MKNIFLILLMLLTASCGKYWYKPMGHLFNKMPKNGSPGFKLGWEHGCNSGLGSQFGGAIYMSFYTWTKDVDIMSSNPDIPKIRNRYKKELKDINWNDPNDISKNFSDYKKIFWGAHIFCRHSVLGILQTAGMDPSLAGKPRYSPGAHSIGNVWNLKGKGDVRIGSTGHW